MDAVPETARIEEWASALRLIFQHCTPEDCERRCANALHLLQRGELDSRNLFVLRGAEGLQGALVCLPVPGASALVWPPGAVKEGREEIEDCLLRHALSSLRDRGAKLAQTLLAPEETSLAASLLRNGFADVTQLWYMRHDLNLPPHCLATPTRLDYLPFDAAADFRDTLARTYVETRDCPEVNGIRTIDEVIQGHRAQGVFDPERWWLAVHNGQPIGVLMMTEMPESGDWEVAYMGVIPEARRLGFGREILLKALTEAYAADAPAVTLSVDARNEPAWHLYHGLGFEPYEQRAVYLAIGR